MQFWSMANVLHSGTHMLALACTVRMCLWVGVCVCVRGKDIANGSRDAVQADSFAKVSARGRAKIAEIVLPSN